MNLLKAICLNIVMVSLCHASADTIYIGLDADMSAVAKTGGIAISRGAQIAINEVNNNGGVLGKKLELIIKNHRGNPARGIDNLEEFSKQENLVAVLGGVHTPVAIKELSTIHRHKIIYLGPWAAGTPIVDNGYEPNFVFRVSVRDKEAGKVFINHAKSLGISKVGLLLEHTAWGKSNEQSINESAVESGIKVVTTEWFNWGQTDYSTSLSNFNTQQIDAIILVANANSGVDIARQILKDQKLKTMPIISHWGLAGGEFVDNLGLFLLRQLNISILQTYSFTTPHNQAMNNYILDQYKNLFDPNITAHSIQGASGVAHAYDLVHLLAKAIEHANSIDRSKIRTSLEQIKQYDGLVKQYLPPFTDTRHDALLADDYMMSRFNENGWLIPIKTSK